MKNRRKGISRADEGNALRARIFISYGRGDDEAFIRRLHDDLTAAGFAVWLDRENLMSRGNPFHQEIKDAIRTEIDRVVYVGGPCAARSANVAEEWRFALECDLVVVVPILRMGEYETEVPEELRLLQCLDFRSDADYTSVLPKLIDCLREENPRLGALMSVPTPPPSYLPRPGLLSDARRALLADLMATGAAIGAKACVGLHGMGGIGKSVLAAALARDRRVRQAYPDGIVWIPLGLGLGADDLIGRQRDIARFLGEDARIDSVAQGQALLRRMLQAKAVLLILDDLWLTADASAFEALGPRGRMLVTTRDAGILSALGGEPFPIELFTEAEALRLLALSAASEPGVSPLPSEAREISAECGFLPLALALCGGMAKSGHSWRDILDALREADIGWPENRASANVRHMSIWNALKISVDALSEVERARFAELSVFRKDTSVPEEAAYALWEHSGPIRDRECAKLLLALADRSLVRLDTRAESGDRSGRRLSLHALLYDYALGIAGDREGLNRRLLDAYRGKCPAGWHSGPNDGYFLENICRHLSLAGYPDESLRLGASIDFATVRCGIGQIYELIGDLQFAIAATGSSQAASALSAALTKEASRISDFMARFDRAGLRGFLAQQVGNRLDGLQGLEGWKSDDRGADGRLRLIARAGAGGEFIARHKIPREGVRRSLFGHARFYPDDSRVLIAACARDAFALDASTARPIGGYRCSGSAIAFDTSPDEGRIVFAGIAEDGDGGFIDVFPEGGSSPVATRALPAAVSGIAVTASGAIVAVCADFKARYYSLDGLASLGEAGGTEAWYSLARSRDRELLALGEVKLDEGSEESCAISIRGKEGLGEIARIDGPKYGVFSLAFSPDGERLAVGSRSLRQGISIRRLDNLDSPVEFLATKDTIVSVLFIDDGLIVAGEGSLERKAERIILWRADGSGSRSSVSGNPSFCVAFAVDAAGKRLASLCATGDVIIWPVGDLEASLALAGGAEREPRAQGYDDDEGIGYFERSEESIRVVAPFSRSEFSYTMLYDHSTDEKLKYTLSLDTSTLNPDSGLNYQPRQLFLTDNGTGATTCFARAQGYLEARLSGSGDYVLGVRQDLYAFAPCWWLFWARTGNLRAERGFALDEMAIRKLTTHPRNDTGALLVGREEQSLIMIYPAESEGSCVVHRLPEGRNYCDIAYSRDGESILLFGAEGRLDAARPAGKELEFLPSFTGRDLPRHSGLASCRGDSLAFRSSASAKRLILASREEASAQVYRDFPEEITAVTFLSDGILAVTDYYPSLHLLKAPGLDQLAWLPLDEGVGDLFGDAAGNELMVVYDHPSLSGLGYSIFKAVP
jgi:WD40 repeat protein